MYRLVKSTATVFVKEGVTLSFDQAKYTVALYSAHLIPEGRLVSKTDIDSYINNLPKEFLNYLVINMG
jgi:hypothetical protein